MFRLGGFFVYCPTPGFTLGDETTWLDVREQRTGTHAPDPFATRFFFLEFVIPDPYPISYRIWTPSLVPGLHLPDRRGAQTKG